MMKITNRDLILRTPIESFYFAPYDISDELLVDDEVLYKLLSVYDTLFLTFYSISDNWKLEFLKKISCKNSFSLDTNMIFDVNSRPINHWSNNISHDIHWTDYNASSDIFSKYIHNYLIEKLSLEDMSINFALYAYYTRGIDFLDRFDTKSIIARYSYMSIPLIISDLYKNTGRSINLMWNTLSANNLSTILSLCENYNFDILDDNDNSPTWSGYLHKSINASIVINFLTRILNTNNYHIIHHIEFVNLGENETTHIGYTSSMEDVSAILGLIGQVVLKIGYNQYVSSYHNFLKCAISMCQSESDFELLFRDSSIFQIYPIRYYFSRNVKNYSTFRNMFIDKLNTYHNAILAED